MTSKINVNLFAQFISGQRLQPNSVHIQRV